MLDCAPRITEVNHEAVIHFDAYNNPDAHHGFLNDLSAQDDLTISECEQRCGRKTDTGVIIGNYQAIAACRDRCSREIWKKVDRNEKELEETR